MVYETRSFDLNVDRAWGARKCHEAASLEAERIHRSANGEDGDAVVSIKGQRRPARRLPRVDPLFCLHVPDLDRARFRRDHDLSASESNRTRIGRLERCDLRAVRGDDNNATICTNHRQTFLVER